jgi:DNA-binding NarL/FixJ family response regulator
MLSHQPATLRVLVVDDHELTRFSLKLALSSHENIELVGLASNGQEAIEMVKRYHPDVIILDYRCLLWMVGAPPLILKILIPKLRLSLIRRRKIRKLKNTTRIDNLDAFCKKDTATPELIKLVKELGQRVASQ